MFKTWEALIKLPSELVRYVVVPYLFRVYKEGELAFYEAYLCEVKCVQEDGTLDVTIVYAGRKQGEMFYNAC